MVEAKWAKTPGSDNRLNKMTNIVNTGTYLGTLNKAEHGLFICTEDGDIFTADNLYLCKADGTSVKNITATQDHTHSGGNGDGGDITLIYADNPEVIDLLLTKTTDLYEASWASPVYWNKTVTGTGSVENFTDGTTGERAIRMRPNGTSGSGSTIYYPHLELDFTEPSVFATKVVIETASSIALHVGVNADDVTAADSNTVKYQAEVCTATNNNWWLRTASGSANSASDTGVAIGTGRTGFRMIARPDLGTPEVNIEFGAGAAVFQKTTNIPVTSETARNNLVKFSVKNSTGADRPLKEYGCRLSYTTVDDWGYGY